MSVDSGSGDDLTGLSAEVADTFERLADIEAIDDWSVRHMVATMVPLLAALSVLQLVSGSVLETYEELLLTYPALLVLVPVQIGTAGNLGSIMSSRMSTQLHLGTFELAPSNPAVRANVGAVFGLGLTVFTTVGVAAWAIGRFLGGELSLATVMVISLASGMLLTLLVVVFSLSAITASYRLGYNPDDTTIPLVTNLCDVGGVLILFLVAVAVL